MSDAALLAGSSVSLLPSCNSADALINLPIRQQILIIASLKSLYEDSLKRKDFAGIEELKYALAFTGADGVTLNPEDLPTKVGSGKKDMLSVMQAMLANVRKALS